ncbi:MAG: DUF3086 domain-containing protein [Synechococcaceae cyanobacterium]|nr:DUF3086 domain-containing protein [Synechococcaceae cyanobacterium]
MTDPPQSAPAETAACPAQDAAPESAGVPAEALQPLLSLATTELRQRRDELEREVRELEQRREAIQREISASFSGQSDAIARRVKGFQDYLVGALQDLAAATEQMALTPPPVLLQPSPLDLAPQAPEPVSAASDGGLFAADQELIRERLQAFSGQPDFQADPWKLRRTLDAGAASLLEDWFLAQGGRGAQPSGGSRYRNVVTTAAAIAVLGELYGDRFQTLVLAGEPERLGEWRRGLQDCLGLSRDDFGPSSGIVLFERADALIERADRLEERQELPFIVVDAGERQLAIPVLQFPLWLAFAATEAELEFEDTFDR